MRSQLPSWEPPPIEAEHILFCGWRRDLDDVIIALDKVVGAGSTLTMLSSVPKAERDEMLREGGLDVEKLLHLKILHKEGSHVERTTLEELELEKFNSVHPTRPPSSLTSSSAVQRRGVPPPGGHGGWLGAHLLWDALSSDVTAVSQM